MTVRTKMPSIPYLDKNFRAIEGHVINLKMDGEDSSVYADGYFHIRSVDSTSPSKDSRAKVWASMVSPILANDNLHRMVFENVYDQHSIHYKDDNALHCYYQCLFLTEMRDGVEWVVDYKEQAKFCSRWGIGMPPLVSIANGINSLSIYAKNIDLSLQEGIVVRHPGSFEFSDIPHYVGKWVRPNHVQTDNDWKRKSLEPNQVVYKNEELIEYGFHSN